VVGESNEATVEPDQLVDALQRLNQKLGVCDKPTLVDTDYANKDSDHLVGLGV
jgi:hypothetical protein